MATNGFRDFPKPGLGSVGSYQMAGTPWVTGTILPFGQEVHIAFPAVTKTITIFTPDTGVYLTWLATGSDAGIITGKHRIAITPTGSNLPQAFTFDVKCKNIFLHNIDGAEDSADITVYASLTGIEAGNMFHLTGSGITE